MGAAGQFATVTPTLAVPVRLLASVMMTEIVCAPFDTTVVFQGIEVGESAQGCCATCTPSTFTVQMGVPCAPPGHTITQFVPLTVSPGIRSGDGDGQPRAAGYRAAHIGR